MNINLFFKKEITKLLLLITFVTIFICVFSCGKDNKNEPQGNKTDPQKSEAKNNTGNGELKESDKFKITYSLVGRMNGQMDILRNGNILKQITNSEIMGMQNTNTVYIINDEVYSVIEAGKQKFASKTGLKDYNGQKQTGETIVDFKEFEKFLSDKKIIGKENILGYDCDIYESGGMNLSVYNKRYVLKIKNSEFMATATNIDSNPVFAPNEFNLPTDVDFKTVNPSSEVDKKALDSLIKNSKK